MTRPGFSYRPNLLNDTHRKAWDLLQSVPAGQKNNFITNAILRFSDEKCLETMLRQIVRDELAQVSLPQTHEQTEKKTEIPGQMLDFVDSLFADKP